MPIEVVASEPGLNTGRQSSVAPDAGGSDDLRGVVDAGWKDGDGRVYGHRLSKQFLFGIVIDLDQILPECSRCPFAREIYAAEASTTGAWSRGGVASRGIYCGRADVRDCD